MKLRLVALSVGLYLILGLLACSKPADNTTSDNSETTAPAAQAPGKAQPKAKVEAKPVVVPAGTQLTVRLGEAVGSKISQPGQSFSATLANAVEVEGKTAIPEGATASGTVVDAKPLGRFKGGAVLQLRLTSITVNGAAEEIQTSAITHTEKGKGKRTAVAVGGGAGLGALVGGLVGGGKGAAIGAAAGAGAGTAGTAFTGNKEIVIPAESALSFKLEQPLEIKQ